MDAGLITIKPQVSAVLTTRMMLDTTFTCGVSRRSQETGVRSQEKAVIHQASVGF